MNHNIRDSFMNPDRFGFAAVPFKLSDSEPRSDIAAWRIARSNARSMGKPTYQHTKPCHCGSKQRRVYNNECYPCFILEKKK